MTPNEEYYEDTVLENQVPWTNVGRILDEADPRYEAVGDAFAYPMFNNGTANVL